MRRPRKLLMLIVMMAAGSIFLLKAARVRDMAPAVATSMTSVHTSPRHGQTTATTAFSGPVDFEPDSQRAAWRLGQNTVRLMDERGLLDGSVNRVYVAPGDPTSESLRAARAFSESLAHPLDHRNVTVYLEDSSTSATSKRVRRRDGVYVYNKLPATLRPDSLVVLVTESVGEGSETFVAARATAAGIESKVMVKSSNGRSPVPVVPTSDAVSIQFRTHYAGPEDEAALDARDILATKIESELERHAMRDGRLGPMEVLEFREALVQNYDSNMLISQGGLRLETDSLSDGDDPLVATWVSWAANPATLRSLASGVVDGIVLEKRLPFIRMGLAIGLGILCILLWLRVDWWLKGHYSLLSRLAFVILFVAGLGLIWSFRP